MQCKSKPEIALTLIPPSPVTDKIVLDVRGALRNSQNMETAYEVCVYLDNETAHKRLHSETINIPAKSAGGISFRWPTKDNSGEHKLIFVAKSKLGILRISQTLKILATTDRSTGRIDGAWAGIYHWSEEEGKHWNKDIKNKQTSPDRP